MTTADNAIKSPVPDDGATFAIIASDVVPAATSAAADGKSSDPLTAIVTSDEGTAVSIATSVTMTGTSLSSRLWLPREGNDWVAGSCK